MSTSFAPSVCGPLSDLDGFSVQGDLSYPAMHSQSFPPQDADDFGFDPAPTKSVIPIKMEQNHSPSRDSTYSGFSFDSPTDDQSYPPTRALELDRMMAQNIPNLSSAVPRYGQVTPPRSNSESSEKADQKMIRPKRVTKTSTKEELAQPAINGRKRRNTRKDSTDIPTGNPEEDHKRKQSLEKNRLAAAKCRVNKKDKTEKLQRDSHDKAVQNAFMKEQVMRMKEEVQQMNAMLLAHANCEGCKSPAKIQEHLNNLGNDFYTQHIQGYTRHDFQNFSNMPYESHDMDQESYYSPTTDPSLLNPPLPEFSRETTFDMGTPMHID